FKIFDLRVIRHSGLVRQCCGFPPGNDLPQISRTSPLLLCRYSTRPKEAGRDRTRIVKIVARQGLARWGEVRGKGCRLLRRQPLCPLSYGRARPVSPSPVKYGFPRWVSRPSPEIPMPPTPLIEL